MQRRFNKLTNKVMKNKKIVYPKVDGEKFDIIRRRLFDSLRESFEWVIREEIKQVDDGKLLTKEQVEKLATVIAWNCAFMAVTGN